MLVQVFTLLSSFQFMEDKKNVKLTVSTSVGLQSESDSTVGIPVQGDQADVAGDHRVLQLVLDHTVCVSVSWKGLGKKKTYLQQLIFWHVSTTQRHKDSCEIPPSGCLL